MGDEAEGERASPAGDTDEVADERPPSDVFDGLQQVTDGTLSYLSLEDMLAELLERIRLVISADTAAILLLDQDRNVLLARAARGIEEEVREGVQIPVGRGFAGRIAAERRPVAIEDVDHADILNPLLAKVGIRSLLGVPLLVEGRVIGVLHVGTLTHRLFGEDDISLLQVAADRAALGIDRAQLSEQRSVTEIMQRTLLPNALPQIPGLRLSAKYIPAGSGIKIGGDWYDVFTLPDGRVALVIGDVVGRGVVAASVMAETRTALRAYAMEGHDLPAMMSLLNELLLGLGRNRSATATIVAIDLEHDQLSAVSAGHLPALVRYPDGRAEFIAQSSGLPLGISSAHRYTEQRWRFPAGSALLLYTDGLVERRGESIDRGLERVRDGLLNAASAHRLSLADRMFDASSPSASVEDDTALLAVECVPIGRELEMTLEATPSSLATLRRAISRWLAEHDMPEPERGEVTRACANAVAEAIGNPYRASHARLDIACRCLADEVVMTISDANGTAITLTERLRPR